MANPNNPFGFRPLIKMGGGPFSVREYGKAAADANPIFAFDLVGHLTGGTPFPLPENPVYNLSRIQSATQLTPGTSLYLGASLSYGAASVGSVHPVADEVDTIFLTQCSGATVITSAAAAGLNANVLNTLSVLNTKQSQMQLNSAGIATTSSLDLRIIEIAKIVPNVEGANAIVEVLINKHAFGQATAGS